MSSSVEIPIQLNTDIPDVYADWNDIFILHQHHEENVQSNVIIHASLLDETPLKDTCRPTVNFESSNGSYSLAYTTDGRSMLTVASGAVLCLPDLNQPFNFLEPISADMFVTQDIIEMGQIEDVTFTLLAPILRRYNIFIVHAFGVTHPTKPVATLIIGGSGQGKTTTGLSLINEGWRFLGNDAIFLSKNNQNQIIAWPSPGKINLHPKSLEILETTAFVPSYPRLGSDGKYHFSATSFANQTSPPAPVYLQLFPSVVYRRGESRFKKITASIALSQTLEQSVDHWDSQILVQHFSFLEQLTSQSHRIQAENTADLSNYGKRLMALLKAK